jgi:hypothetical protein
MAKSENLEGKMALDIAGYWYGAIKIVATERLREPA